jgi:hypothetical protein
LNAVMRRKKVAGAGMDGRAMTTVLRRRARLNATEFKLSRL